MTYPLHYTMQIELIEVASTEDDPNRRWHQIIFYRLSRRGWYEVVRQDLHFAANEETILPNRVAGIYTEIERYVRQYQIEPHVQVKGTRFEAYPTRCATRLRNP